MRAPDLRVGFSSSPSGFQKQAQRDMVLRAGLELRDASM